MTPEMSKCPPTNQATNIPQSGEGRAKPVGKRAVWPSCGSAGRSPAARRRCTAAGRSPAPCAPPAWSCARSGPACSHPRNVLALFVGGTGRSLDMGCLTVWRWTECSPCLTTPPHRHQPLGAEPFSVWPDRQALPCVSRPPSTVHPGAAPHTSGPCGPAPGWPSSCRWTACTAAASPLGGGKRDEGAPNDGTKAIGLEPV